MKFHHARFWSLTAATLVVGAAACSSSSNNLASSNTKTPILIGATLSLTGDFSADGQAFRQGYNLWVSDGTAAGTL